MISANAPTPSVVSTVSHVGTMLFDVEVQPGTGDVWVPNIDSRNLVRFEPNLRGHLVQTRVSIVDPGSGGVTPVDLNPHINYAVSPGPAQEIAESLANPGDGVFSADGSTFYLTALSSRKVGVLDAFGDVTDLIDVGNGPSGVALNEADGRLYVLNRIDNTISTVDTGTNTADRRHRRGRPVAVRSQPRRHQERAQVPLRRPAHLGPWGHRLRDLSHVRATSTTSRGTSATRRATS